MRFLDFLRLQGYKPFHGAVSAAVYAAFRCADPSRGRWYHKPGSYQCVGCREQCETDSREGFQASLLTEKDDGR